jgi:hypothetical protein
MKATKKETRLISMRLQANLLAKMGTEDRKRSRRISELLELGLLHEEAAVGLFKSRQAAMREALTLYSETLLNVRNLGTNLNALAAQANKKQAANSQVENTVRVIAEDLKPILRRLHEDTIQLMRHCIP